MRRIVAAAALVLAAACSLPLPHGVHAVGAVVAPSSPPPPLQVTPPGPVPGESPTDTVLRFLGAQADADNNHAIARSFLSTAFRDGWRDDLGVRVYDPDQLQVSVLPGGGTDRVVVRVSYADRGQLRVDGSYVVGSGDRTTEQYDLQRQNGSWVIASGPEGLLLTEADRARTFAPRNVYFVAPHVAGGSPHLVADRIFLPLGGDLPTALVTRLLAGPSSGLAGSVGTAVPAGAHLHGKVTVDGSGVATVSLDTGTVPTGQALSDLSAQLAWTLDELGDTVRLVTNGVHPHGDPLSVDQYAGYDPDPLGLSPPYYYVVRRSLRVSAGESAERPGGHAAPASLPFPVDQIAVTPDRSQAALLENGAHGLVTVRVGQLTGTSFPVVARAPALTSPSWGSAELGLWLIRGRQDVVLLRGGTSAPRVVPVEGRPAGDLTSLAVSRDGARVSMVVAGRVYVGRVVLRAGSPVISDLTAILPQVRQAIRVAWSTGTDIAVLGALSHAGQVMNVAIDGSSVVTLNTAGLSPTDLAASPTDLVLVSGGLLYEARGSGFRKAQPEESSAPIFPG